MARVIGVGACGIDMKEFTATDEVLRKLGQAVLDNMNRGDRNAAFVGAKHGVSVSFEFDVFGRVYRVTVENVTHRPDATGVQE